MIYTPGTALTLYGARAHPWPPSKKTLKFIMIYLGHQTNPKYGAWAPPWPPSKKP